MFCSKTFAYPPIYICVNILSPIVRSTNVVGAHGTFTSKALTGQFVNAALKYVYRKLYCFVLRVRLTTLHTKIITGWVGGSRFSKLDENSRKPLKNTKTYNFLAQACIRVSLHPGLKTVLYSNFINIFCEFFLQWIGIEFSWNESCWSFLCFWVGWNRCTRLAMTFLLLAVWKRIHLSVLSSFCQKIHHLNLSRKSWLR